MQAIIERIYNAITELSNPKWQWADKNIAYSEKTVWAHQAQPFTPVAAYYETYCAAMNAKAKNGGRVFARKMTLSY